MDEIELASKVYVNKGVYSDMEERHRLIEAFKAGADWVMKERNHICEQCKDYNKVGCEITMDENKRLSEKIKRYCWHNLRKNPKDLPPIGKEVYCYYENGDELTNMRTNDINIDRNENGWYLYPLRNMAGIKLIAWIYIPSFEQE